MFGRRNYKRLDPRALEAMREEYVHTLNTWRAACDQYRHIGDKGAARRCLRGIRHCRREIRAIDRAANRRR